jgi:hypothetical protein
VTEILLFSIEFSNTKKIDTPDRTASTGQLLQDRRCQKRDHEFMMAGYVEALAAL